MLGGGGSQGNGAFSSASSALPPARRHHHHHQQTAATTTAACWKANNPFNSLSGSVVVPSTASEEATVAHQQHQQQQPTVQHQRKRPGCLCDHYDDDDEEEEESISLVRHCYNQVDSTVQPLDLSLPKVKVRQHWSGGSIVQVNDSTIISINSAGGGRGGAECCGCPASTGASSTTGSSPLLASSRLNVSVVTVPQQPCWPAGNNNTLPIDRHHPHHQQPQPFRLQIEIPFVADKLSGFFRQQQQQHHHHHRRKSSNNSTSLLRPPEVAAAATNVMTDEEDDLQRLSDSAHQLRLSGYYYGHLTWKDSIQLLQNTKVGTFLVRDSSDARFLYALSLQTDKGPTSVRIHYSSRGFRLDASNPGMADHLPRFRTVLDLIDHYVAKWSQCRDKGQFWLDDSGQVHSEVVLIRPLMRDCPPLKHLCRLAWNNRRRQQTSANHSCTTSSVKIPPTIQSYLNEYPYQH